MVGVPGVLNYFNPQPAIEDLSFCAETGAILDFQNLRNYKLLYTYPYCVPATRDRLWRLCWHRGG